MMNTTTLDSGKYLITLDGEEIFEGSFADAVTEYLGLVHEAQRFARENPMLLCCGLRSPLAQMEQVITTLWPTVPKFSFNEYYEEVVDNISSVIDFFASGDITSFRETFEGTDFTHAHEVLQEYETALHDYFLPPEDLQKTIDDFNRGADEFVEDTDDGIQTAFVSYGADGIWEEDEEIDVVTFSDTLTEAAYA